MVKKICKGCNKPFDSSRIAKTYCSKDCYPSIQKIAPKNRVCPLCQREFIGKTKFCSEKCYIYFEQNRRREQKMARKKSSPKAKCLWCGVEFSKISPINVYCTLECGNEFRRMQRRILKSFDSKKCLIELDKLRKEGKNYVESQI
jgi:predicted nucleic acid-binding Zn ribbon protein